MHERLFTTSLALLLSLALISRAADPHPPAASNAVDPDTRFIADQSTDGLLIIKLSMVAAEKADTEDVKKFANEMIDKQATVNTELKQLATTRQLELAVDLPPEGQKEVQDISQKYGRPFDRAYMVSLLKQKSQTLGRLEKHAVESKDPQLRAFATRAADTVRQQIAQARQLAIKVGVEELDPKVQQSTASSR